MKLWKWEIPDEEIPKIVEIVLVYLFLTIGIFFVFWLAYILRKATMITNPWT